MRFISSREISLGRLPTRISKCIEFHARVHVRRATRHREIIGRIERTRFLTINPKDFSILQILSIVSKKGLVLRGSRIASDWVLFERRFFSLRRKKIPCYVPTYSFEIDIFAFQTFIAAKLKLWLIQLLCEPASSTRFRQRIAEVSRGIEKRYV